MQYSTNQAGSKEYVSEGNAFLHFQCLSNELANVKVLLCPTDVRMPAANFRSLQNSNVSYFIAVDAEDVVPMMPLAGDRNLMTNGVAIGAGLAVIKTNYAIGWTEKMHHNDGNILFVDGHVERLNRYTRLPEALVNTDTNSTRLAIP